MIEWSGSGTFEPYGTCPLLRDHTISCLVCRIQFFFCVRFRGGLRAVLTLQKVKYGRLWHKNILLQFLKAKKIERIKGHPLSGDLWFGAKMSGRNSCSFQTPRFLPWISFFAQLFCQSSSSSDGDSFMGRSWGPVGGQSLCNASMTWFLQGQDDPG